MDYKKMQINTKDEIESLDGRIDVTHKVLALAKRDELTEQQKNQIYHLILNMEASEIQKDRFFKFFNLDINNTKKYHYASLAKACNCSMPAIKQILQRIRVKITNDIELMELFLVILKDYKKSMDKTMLFLQTVDKVHIFKNNMHFYILFNFINCNLSILNYIFA